MRNIVEEFALMVLAGLAVNIIYGELSSPSRGRRQSYSVDH